MYEQRILNFLRKNPKLKVTDTDLARIWKRNTEDVWKSAFTLVVQNKIIVDPKGVLSLAK